MKKNKLHTIKDNGFKVPKGYFESFEDHITSELKLKELISENHGFKIPNEYFDILENEIVTKVPSSNSSKVISLLNQKTITYISGVAAAVLLIFSLTFFENKPSFDTLDNETVENYVLDENIGSYEIASLLTEEELTEEDFVEFNLDEETVEDFILDNLDVEDLY